MKEFPDHHDAELLLRLYDLRREEKLRRARDWMFAEFNAHSMDELYKKYPAGSEENAYYRMTVSYWDMAASIVNHGLIREELFFESNAEFWGVWIKLQPVVAEARAKFKNPKIWHNLEILAGKYEKWMEQHAPGALAVRREQFKLLGAKKTGSS